MARSTRGETGGESSLSEFALGKTDDDALGRTNDALGKAQAKHTTTKRGAGDRILVAVCVMMAALVTSGKLPVKEATLRMLRFFPQVYS